MTAVGSHGPLWIDGAFVSGDYFTVLRTTPLRGRLLMPDDDRPAAAPVAVVTNYFWRTHLDGRDDAIGCPVLLGESSSTVVGVAPPRFHGLSLPVRLESIRSPHCGRNRDRIREGLDPNNGAALA